MVMKGNCLDEDILTDYLEGTLDGPVRAAAEAHLVDCDGCRNQLACCMRVLDEEVREEEQALIQKAMSVTHLRNREVRVVRTSPVAFVRWAALAAAILICITAATFVDFSFGPTAAEIVRTLASSERPFRARLSEQLSLPLRQTRGSNSVSDAAYLEGEMLDATDVDDAHDAYLLGTLYLYTKEFDRAIGLLSKAAEGAGTAPVYNNLGAAYLERPAGSADELAVNRTRARDAFEQALELDSEFEASMYNLVVLFKQQNLHAEFTVQQAKYLDLDSESDWADEVREMGGFN